MSKFLINKNSFKYYTLYCYNPISLIREFHSSKALFMDNDNEDDNQDDEVFNTIKKAETQTTIVENEIKVKLNNIDTDLRGLKRDIGETNPLDWETRRSIKNREIECKNTVSSLLQNLKDRVKDESVPMKKFEEENARDIINITEERIASNTFVLDKLSQQPINNAQRSSLYDIQRECDEVSEDYNHWNRAKERISQMWGSYYDETENDKSQEVSSKNEGSSKDDSSSKDKSLIDDYADPNLDQPSHMDSDD